MSLPAVGRPPYDPSKGFVVRQAFYSGGRHLKPGDPFDPRFEDCDQRRILLLWSEWFLECGPGEKPDPEPVEPEPPLVADREIQAVVVKGDFPPVEE